MTQNDTCNPWRFFTCLVCGRVVAREFSGDMTKVLIVDDEPVQLRLTAEVAKRAGFDALTAQDGNEALAILKNTNNIGVMVLDLVMPDLDGMGVMEAMQREGINVPVIVQTANASLETVISAMRHGASDYFVKPVAPERLTISLRNALKLDQLEACVRTERAKQAGAIGIKDIITKSAVMDRVLSLVKKAATSTIPVLIEGETGTGKEMIARAIQGSGDRAGKPFVTVNCGAIPANLVETTLFGHVKGAFTGANEDHKGKFEEAHNGTLFLDEVGELPAETQVKLLRAIQEGEIEPVGSSKTRNVNVRLISATNRRLLNMAREGTFREDLYYRLNVFPIYLPPLRERPEDILPLADHFIAKLAPEARRRIHGITDNAREMLMEFNWSGNVRQLENALFRAIVLSENAYLQRADFPQIMAQLAGREQTAAITQSIPTPASPTHIDDMPMILGKGDAISPTSDRFLTDHGEVATLATMERDLIVFALDHHKGRMAQVARTLGIGRSTLYRKLKEYGLDEDNAKTAA